jgi:hypothetical protein
MQESTAGRPAPIAAILAIVGGVLLAIGSFLAWAEVGGGGTSVTAKGVDGSDGYITLATGVIVLIAGLMIFRGAGKRVLAIIALVAALIGGAVGLYDALTAKDRVLDDAAEELAGQYGGTTAEVRALLDQAIDAGELSISISFGLYMVILGGALGIVGGVLAMRGAAAAPAMPAAASTGFVSAMPPAEPTMPSMPEPPMPEPPSMPAPPDDAGGSA